MRNSGEILPARQSQQVQHQEEISKTKVCACFCYNTENEEQINHYNYQIQYFTNLIESNSNWEFVGIYADERNKNVEYNRMLDGCKKSQIELVVTQSIGKFTSNITDCLYYSKVLKEINIPIYFIKENITTMDSGWDNIITHLEIISHEKINSLNTDIPNRFARGFLRMKRVLSDKNDEDNNEEKLINRNNKFKKVNLLIFAYLLTFLITILVYVTGGTSKVYPNFMYVPIAISASTNGKKQGMIHGIISGFLVGPFMPLDVVANIPQEPFNWIIRVVIYPTIAFVVGFFADYYNQEIEKNSTIEKEIAEAQMATIYALVKLSESRDDDTGAHIERVAEFCKLLTIHLRNTSKYRELINDNYIDNIYKASSLHDIGKVGIPDNILLKPGKLTQDEFEIIKKHTTIGANNLLEVKKMYPNNKFLELGISIAHFHHEKWDGTGYPYGLAEENIPLSARIMALVDVYEALRSKRIYKEAYSHKESLEIIKQGKGSHFDPIILNTFIENEKEFNNTFEKITEKIESIGEIIKV